MRTAAFVKTRRKAIGLTQPQFAKKAGVGLRFLRELEQGKDSLRMDKVNEVLRMFGHELEPVRVPLEYLLPEKEPGAVAEYKPPYRKDIIEKR